MSGLRQAGFMLQDDRSLTAQAAFDAFSRCDADAVSAVLKDFSLLHVGGDSGLAGTYQGAEAIVGLLRRMVDLTDATLRLTSTTRPELDGWRAVIEGRADAVRRGRQLSTTVRLALLVEDGCACEIWLDCADQSQFDDFWG